jgi:Trk K+ transport system NAD-binding subunit
VEKARAVIANMTDTENVNLILTVRSLCPVPVITLLDNPGRRTFMELAGAQEVVPLKEVLGRYLAVRSTTRGAFAHVVDSYGELMFAELPLHGCDLVGRTLEASRIREATGVSVIGVWERGRLLAPDPGTVLEEGAVLLFAGTAEQLEALEQIAGAADGADRVLILGHGTVGRSAVAFLEKNNVDYRVVDLAAPADVPDHLLIVGDACNEGTLNEAGIMEAKGAIVTTNDDGANVFLTLVCRQLNPALRLVARANREENVAELYAAGADFVVSLVSVGATILLNILEGKESTFLTEGVYIFWRQVPDNLDGRTVAQAQLRTRTGATLVAVGGAADEPLVQGSPDLVLRTGMSLLLVGPPEAEERLSQVLRK